MDELNDRYSRQMLFAPIGRPGQEKLGNSTAVIIGLGALGSVIAQNLARAGIGRLRLVDRDFVEKSNLQRQALYNESDAASSMPKAVAAERQLRLINSSIVYESVVRDVNFTNIESLIEDANVVLDGSDNLEVRYLINDACIKHNISWIYGACVASYGLAMPVIPKETPCLQCLFPGRISHTGHTCDTVGIINPISNIIASLQTAEALKLLVGDKEAVSHGLITFDVWHNDFSCLPIPRNSECPVCGQGIFRYLEGEAGLRTTSLCGRNAVQVSPDHKIELDLTNLMKRLQPLGEVSTNGFLVNFRIDSYEVVIFGDGRAIIKGTDDESKARAVYARYIGA